ncbi:hypothetical protein [Caproicibacter sp.]|uniref:hypothetical protein n=1 Tax=Caproicibacter sp. TaxID=2814884 RepID=UPI0039894C48
MEKQERVKAILGISLLYIIVTSIFSLINKICSILISQNVAGVKIRSFLYGNLLWVMTAAIIIIALILYLKKLNEGLHSLLENSLIRITAGLLVALEGIIRLSIAIPLYVASIQSAIQTSHMMQQSMQRMLTEVISLDVVSVLIFICQIFAGFYLIKFHKNKTD